MDPLAKYGAWVRGNPQQARRVEEYARLAALFLPPCIEGDSLANAATAIATVAAPLAAATEANVPSLAVKLKLSVPQ